MYTGWKVVLLCVLVSCSRLCAVDPVWLESASMSLGLDADTGDLVGLKSRVCGTSIVDPVSGDDVDGRLWSVTVRTPDGVDVTIVPTDAASFLLRRAAGGAELHWRGISVPEIDGQLAVTVTISTDSAESRSLWEFQLDGEVAGGLWEVHFPRLAGMAISEHEAMTVPRYLGRLVRNPRIHDAGFRLEYPQPASMQWLSFWGTPDRRDPVFPDVSGEVGLESGWRVDERDATGIYLAAEDGDGWHKRFVSALEGSPPRLTWEVHHLPRLSSWPLSAPRHRLSYRIPYPVAVSCFRGDYHEAGAMYLSWARDQSWCRRGPLSDWPSRAPVPGSLDEALWTPPWFRDICLWAKFYHEPAKILPEWAAYREWLQVPMASHYYRYTISRFDDNYPEALPGDPYLLNGMMAARAMGVQPLPYINGVIWDTDTQSWFGRDGFRSAIKDEQGNFVPWDIHGNIFAYMCPTRHWQETVADTTAKLVGEHGMAGVYLDCLAATRAIPCYDAAHNHGIRGGTYRAQGNRRLMETLRAGTRRLDPGACFFTEEIGEQYLDVMDGFLTLDFIRSSVRGGESVFPLFSTVYHPFTINFGSDAQLDMPDDEFALQLGTLFVWGSVPLLSAMVAVPPESGDANSEFLREVVQSYHQVGLPFLRGGAWQRLVVRPVDGESRGSPLELQVPSHGVVYDKRRGVSRRWRGPAVLASAWRCDGRIGVVLANISDTAAEVTLTVRPDSIGVSSGAILRQLWPETLLVGGASGTRALTIGDRRVMILEICDSNRRAVPRRVPAACPWELLTVKDGPFRAMNVSPGSVWACDDGFMTHRPGPGDVVTVVAQNMHPDGAVVRRRGHMPEPHGARVEGHGLPRRRLDQPFCLARRLPHQLDLSHDGTMTVYGGGPDWLDCELGGPGRLRFAEPGIICSSAAAPDSAVIEWAAEVAVPAAGTRHVGYWACGDTALHGVESQLARSGVPPDVIEKLSSAMRSLRESADAAALSGFTREVRRLAEACRSRPAMLTPGKPVSEIVLRSNALVHGLTGRRTHLLAEDDWISPGLTKHVLAVEVGGGTVTGIDGVLAGGEPQAGSWSRYAHMGTGPGEVVVRVAESGYVEHVIPLVAYREQVVNTASLTECATTWLECNRPFELRISSSPVIAVSGREVTMDATLRNWSPLSPSVTMSLALPEGWTLVEEIGRHVLPPLTDTRISFRLRSPVTTPSGLYEVPCTVSYSGEPDGHLRGQLPVLLSEALAIRVRDIDSEAMGGVARLRHRNRIGMYAEAGESVEILAKNIRVTRYIDTLRLEFLDATLDAVESKRVPVDENTTWEHTATSTGMHYVVVDAGNGSAELSCADRVLFDIAAQGIPLNLFCSPVTRWFYVPSDADEFSLAARDGGPSETARMTITSPNGRVALDRDGNWKGLPHRIDVRPGERGRVWRLTCSPRQDIGFWLSGDVCSCLSPDPARIPVPVREVSSGDKGTR